MSAAPGWYPDPAGTPGRYRFWDGRAWGPDTTDRPDPAHPGRPALVFDGAPATGKEQSYRAALIPPSRRPRGWWLAAAALLVAVAVIAALVVRSLGGTLIDGPDLPGDDPSQQSCPRTSSTASPAVPSTGDRVRSGRLSYPRLPAPFTAPIADSRTPFGHDVQSQQAFVERSPDRRTTWVAWALIARLMAGDGFYGPQQGAGVVADCVVDLFYNNHEIQRTDTRREAISVDGHEAYLIESHLTFDIPGIQAKGETMIVVVVDVGQQGEAGLFYGTIPDNSPQFLPMVRAALADLQVG
jgi:hypothetical protein